MGSPYIVSHEADGVATIALDRPGRRNSLDQAMIDTFTDALAHYGTADRTRAIVLLGEGDAFSAGADLDELGELAERGDVDRLNALARARANLVRRLALQTSQPVIAVVDGPATGLGLSIVLAADLVLATGRARFGVPHTRLGLHPDSGLTFLLPTRIGPGPAHELLWTGRVFDAHDAVRVGLARRITASRDVDRDRRALVSDVLDVPRALQPEIKRGLRAHWEPALEAAFRAEQDSLRRTFDSAEFLQRLDARRRRSASR